MASNIDVISHLLAADADIPNNPHLPLLVYPAAVALDVDDPASVFEHMFTANDWVGCWRNGIYPFHHYHSTAHEVLGVYAGSAVAQLGGEGGVRLTLNAGDVVIIPAGVGHKKISSSGSFGVVGAYPGGQSPDIRRAGSAGSRRTPEQAAGQVAKQVARVGVPPRDPVHGSGGPMCRFWSQ